MAASLKNLCLRTLTHHPQYIDMYRLPVELLVQLHLWFEIKGRMALGATKYYISSEIALSQLCRRYVTPIMHLGSIDSYDDSYDDDNDAVNVYNYTMQQVLERKTAEYTEGRIDFFAEHADYTTGHIRVTPRKLAKMDVVVAATVALSATFILDVGYYPLIFDDLVRPENVLILVKGMSPRLTARGIADNLLYGPIYVR